MYVQVSFSCPEAVVTSVEQLLGPEAGEEVLAVRDGEGRFGGGQERKLGSALAQLPLRQAAGEVRPIRSGRVEGSLLYPSKCSAWSHGAAQQNLPGVKRKKERDRKGTRDKGRNKVKKCAVKLLAAKRGESHFQLLSSRR